MKAYLICKAPQSFNHFFKETGDLKANSLMSC